ncbi:MAG TPA: hypothetical protein VFH89_14105 [Sphingomicrobium sp.]|nr:hypothetical protein [Sphingomicrobium sp.]
MKMHRAVRAIAAVCALSFCQPAAACNKDAFELPWDLANADTVVVAKISNFRIVPNEAQSQRIKAAVNAGTADTWQLKRYEENVSNGLPPGGTFGLFEVSVREVLKGKAARRFTAIFPDTRLCCFGDKEPSILPASMTDQDAIIGLREGRTAAYYGLELPLLAVDACVGPMLFSPTDDTVKAARKYLGSKRRD